VYDTEAPATTPNSYWNWWIRSSSFQFHLQFCFYFVLFEKIVCLFVVYFADLINPWKQSKYTFKHYLVTWITLKTISIFDSVIILIYLKHYHHLMSNYLDNRYNG
jgi:hypothetical protein